MGRASSSSSSHPWRIYLVFRLWEHGTYSWACWDYSSGPLISLRIICDRHLDPSGAARGETCQPQCLSAIVLYSSTSLGLRGQVEVRSPYYDVVSYCNQRLDEYLFGEVAPGDVLIPLAYRRDDHHSEWCVMSPASAYDRQTHWSCPLHLQ